MEWSQPPVYTTLLSVASNVTALTAPTCPSRVSAFAYNTVSLLGCSFLFRLLLFTFIVLSGSSTFFRFLDGASWLAIGGISLSIGSAVVHTLTVPSAEALATWRKDCVKITRATVDGNQHVHIDTVHQLQSTLQSPCDPCIRIRLSVILQIHCTRCKISMSEGREWELQKAKAYPTFHASMLWSSEPLNTSISSSSGFFLPVNYTWLIMLSRCLHKEFTWFWAKCNAFYCILVSDKCCHAFSRRVPQSSHIIVRSSQVQTTRFRFIYTPSSFISYSTTNVPMSRFNRADPIIVLKCCQRLWWKHRFDILDRQDVFLREM